MSGPPSRTLDLRSRWGVLANNLAPQLPALCLQWTWGMKKISKLLSTAFTLSSFLVAPSMARATPTAGSNELRIDGAYLVPGASIAGYSHTSVSSPDTTGNASVASQTLMGIGFAYGRFLTDNLEIGTTLSLLYTKSTGAATTAPGIAPFVSGFVMVADRIGVFASGTAGVQVEYRDQSPNVNQLMLGADLGAELFLADSWSLRVGPTYRYLHASMTVGNNSVSVREDVFGVNWAIAGYF